MTAIAELPVMVRPRRCGCVSRVVYEDESHVWVVKCEKGIVTVFRRARGAKRGGNALTLGDLERARHILHLMQQSLMRLETTEGQQND